MQEGEPEEILPDPDEEEQDRPNDGQFPTWSVVY